MEPHLALTYTKQQGGSYKAAVAHQTYREQEFNKTTSVFRTTYGVRLVSIRYPDIEILTLHPLHITVFVRGSAFHCDDITFIIPNHTILDLIKLATHEYNRRR